MQRPGPTIVWLVREGDPKATEGKLSLETEILTFAPVGREQERLTIPVPGISKVRRQRGTPLLVLSRSEGMSKLFFYFAKPPPLPGDRSSAQAPLMRSQRGLARSAAALTLRASNRIVKRDIDEWVRALQEAGVER